MIGKVTMVALALLLSTACETVPSSTATATTIGIVTEDRELERELSSHISNQDGTFGMAVINLTDGRGAMVNADARFPAASLYKLLVMYRVYQAMDRGTLHPNDTITIQDEDVFQDEPDGGFLPGDTPTIQQAVEAMITISSNAAALALTREIGGAPSVDAAARELGMTNTETVDDGLMTTPADIAHFLHLLANQSLVSQQASLEMLNLLLQQTVNDRIPALLPAETAVAHKTGELDDTRNDAGIVYGTGGRYVIVVMSMGGTPDDEAQAEAELSKIVYERYGAAPAVRSSSTEGH